VKGRGPFSKKNQSPWMRPELGERVQIRALQKKFAGGLISIMVEFTRGKKQDQSGGGGDKDKVCGNFDAKTGKKIINKEKDGKHIKKELLQLGKHY